MGKKLVQIGNRTLRLIFDDFEEDMDIDNLLKIDYSNLMGELVTFPVIVNRFGVLLAEAESKVSEAKLNLEVFEAKTKESLRISLADQKGGKVTVEELNNALISKASYQAFRKNLITAQKNRDYINSVFWSAKDKSAKLDKLSLSIQAEDISESFIEGRVNNVLVKKTKKLID